MQRFREVLRNEYIGAITIGFLLAQAAIHLVTAVIQPLSFYLGPRKTMFGTERAFTWEQMILPNVVSAILHLIVAYLIFRWLYPDRDPVSADSTPSGTAS